MKKLLLSTALVALAATPALAQESPLSIDIGGYFNGYLAVVDQDEAVNTEVKDVDILRNTELHLTGETTLDNGLTVGLHFEVEADGGEGANNTFDVEESYMYLSGAWGRVNVGAEDGAAYLLQVAAPSADANIDGIRQLIQPVAYGLTPGALVVGELDYDQDPTGYADKLTYLTPVLNGFQGALSYTPDVADNNGYAQSLAGVRQDDDAADSLEEAYEAAVRYEGQWNELGFAVGAGYSEVERNDATAGNDDVQLWNVGADMDYGPFGLGVVYLEDNNGVDTDEEEVWVVGADYTTGPFKLGASYYTSENSFGTADLETDRYTGGVVYTYGPGMTFRGSVSYVEHDVPAADDIDATSVLVGTQVLF